MIRQFVNVVVENYKSGMYSLHRLDVSKHLFYPSTAQAQELPAANGHGDAQPPMLETLLELPPPCMSFQPSPTNQWLNRRLSFFGLVSPRSSNGSRILCINKAGHAALYDADSQSVDLMPTLPGPNGPRPVSISVAKEGEDEEEELYIFHSDPGLTSGSGCFRVLLRSGTSWHWQPLPPPPFVRSPRYDPAYACSYAVVDGGRTICMSPLGDMGGTYCFDTVEREWKQAGGWVLPFVGGAEYVPDLDLWLGFNPRSPHYLCGTSDLSSMAMDRPPKLQYVWRDIDTPENWLASGINLINLGAGRFCVAKVVVVEPESVSYYDWHTVASRFTVLTGIEISPTASCGGGVHHHQEDNSNKKDLRQGLRVFKHNSLLYHFMDDGLEWVL